MPGSPVLRPLPSVASLLGAPPVRELLRSHPRGVVVAALRRAIDGARVEAASSKVPSSRGEWTARILSRLRDEIDLREGLPMRRVINATGVVIHTNLGRAPLPPEAIAAVAETSRGYTNLEFDLSRGERSSRLSHVDGMLRELTGAGCAHIVNNNAGAVLLCLAGLARGRDVIVSRGELVEIGGSFRIPEIMAESGARLVEVGTTNRTRLSDYENAITDRTALLLKIHRSNFSMHGFTEDVPASELAALGTRAGITVMEDQGSGALIDPALHGVPGASSLRNALRAGPGIVTASGDKLLGGPQAGIILGREDLVGPLKRHPLSRALRADKMCLAALSAVLRLYADERRAMDRVPVLRMLLEPVDRIRSRARRLMRAIRSAGASVSAVIEEGASPPGGGALPDTFLPTACVALSGRGMSESELESRLRRGTPPVVARIGRGKVLLDMRTVGDDEMADLARAVAAAGKNG